MVARESAQAWYSHLMLRPATMLLPLLLLGACAEAGAPCYTSIDCLDNELCVDGRCRLSCKGDDDCFDVDVCRHGYCQAATAAVDAGQAGADAGEGDASAHDAAGHERRDQDASQTDSSTPDTTTPDTVQLDTTTPDTVQHDTTQPDMAQPDMAQPDTSAQVDGAANDAFAPPCNGPAPAPELCDPNDPALRACYTFDHDLLAASDDIQDGSQYANHGTSSDVAHETGVVGLAVSFTGQEGSHISVDDSASLNITGELSIEAWIYARSLPAAGRVGILDNNNQYGLFIFDTGEFRCGVGSEHLYAGAAATGTWTHIACVLDDSGTWLYQDGALAGYRVSSGTISTTPADPMILGANSPSGDNFDGLIDSLRIWQASRSEDEICWAAQR